MEQERGALFNEVRDFSHRNLKKVETKVITGSGEQLIEKRNAQGLQVKTNEEAAEAKKVDLQVGLVLPGLLIASQDVAHDKTSIDTYGITHILNLDNATVENKFTDEYNYKNINIQDSPEFDVTKVFEDCFEFIDEGRRYGNVLVHCSGTIGLSRSTTICVAYLMEKDKKKLDDALTIVKEARSFVKPNEGFMRQLKEFEVKLLGSQVAKAAGIDDPFALKKRQEIEAEKAALSAGSSVKNRMKMFGATLDANAASGSRSKSASPTPFKS